MQRGLNVMRSPIVSTPCVMKGSILNEVVNLVMHARFALMNDSNASAILILSYRGFRAFDPHY